MKKICLISCALRFLRPAAAIGQSILLLALRLIYGGQFVLTGRGKLLHLDQTTQFFTGLHLPAPGFQAVLVGGTEFFGGILLVLGLGTRFATVPLTIVMIVAYLTAERPEAFKDLDAFTSATPYQFLLACLILMAFGPGRAAIDALLAPWFRQRSARELKDSHGK
jgi:putative oxidoreductase